MYTRKIHKGREWLWKKNSGQHLSNSWSICSILFFSTPLHQFSVVQWRLKSHWSFYLMVTVNKLFLLYRHLFTRDIEKQHLGIDNPVSDCIKCEISWTKAKLQVSYVQTNSFLQYLKLCFPKNKIWQRLNRATVSVSIWTEFKCIEHY